MNVRTAAIAFSTLAGLAATPAFAVDLVTSHDPQGVIDALTQIGYQGAKFDPWDTGRPSIAIKISGSPTFIDFYDCDDKFKACETLYFYYAMDLPTGTTLAKANQWNNENVTGRIALDDNGDPTLTYAVSTFDGLPIDVFEETVKLWDTKIGQAKDFFDF